MTFYNNQRPHSALGGRPPVVIYGLRNETTNLDQQVQGVGDDRRTEQTHSSSTSMTLKASGSATAMSAKIHTIEQPVSKGLSAQRY